MYFEDIYYKIYPLWDEEFELKNIENTETYIDSVRVNYNKIDRKLSQEKYSWWEFALLFTMYQTITLYGLKKWKKSKSNKLLLKEIPINLFEKNFRNNMEPEDEFEGNLEYLNKYQGFKNKKHRD